MRARRRRWREGGRRLKQAARCTLFEVVAPAVGPNRVIAEEVAEPSSRFETQITELRCGGQMGSGAQASEDDIREFCRRQIATSRSPAMCGSSTSCR
jgi:hypothetical protein